jgi:hypothetical protein
MLTAWCILLVFVGPFALIGAGMAFEGGHTLDAYIAIAAILSYPLLLAIAYFYRRRRPAFV